MPPEQAGGRGKQVGTAADIYSLGAILYHCLTGRPPFQGGSALETIMQVESTEVVLPRQLRPDVPRDLETICRKCLEKEPHRRYSTALALADDLRCFLEDRPIVARPVGPAGRLARWSRRNPLLASLCAAGLLGMILGTAIISVLYVRALRAEIATQRERDQAETEAANARAINEFLRNDLLAQSSAHHQAGPGQIADPDLKVRTALDRAAERIGKRFADTPVVEASLRHTIGQTYYELGLFRQAIPHLERTIELRREFLGETHPETLNAMIAMGTVYLDDGRFTDAERLFAAARTGLVSTRGADHPDALAASMAMAKLFLAQEKFSEAETLFLDLSERYQRTRGSDALESLEVKNALAIVCNAQGKPERAEALLLDVLRVSPPSLGAEHPVALVALSSLAQLRQSQNNYPEATRLYKEAIVAQRRVLGDTHPETLSSMVKFGAMCAASKRLDEAESLLTEALRGCRTALDRNHDATDNALAALSAVYAWRQDMTRLGKVLLEAIEITRFRHGDDSNMTAQANHAGGVFFSRKASMKRPNRSFATPPVTGASTARTGRVSKSCNMAFACLPNKSMLR